MGMSQNRLMMHGALVGMAVQLALMLHAYLSGSGVSYFGISDQQVTETIWRDYTWIIVRMIVQVAASHLLIGAIMGLLAGRLLLIIRPKTAQTTRKSAATVHLALIVLTLHGALLTTSMARYPQLYVEAFQSSGGWRARFQDLVCSGILSLSQAQLLIMITGFWALLEGRRLLLLRPQANRAKAALAFGTLLVVLLTGLGLYRQEGLLTSRAGAGTIGKDAGKPNPASPNLLVIAVDSLRADRVFAEGNAGVRIAPTISRLAREGTSFTRAYSVLPRTFPAWVSMLTGCYPGTHGVSHMFPTAADRSRIPPAVPQILARKGYTTAVVTDFAGDIFSRVELGFDRVEAPYFHFPTVIKQRILELDYHLLPYVTNGPGRRLFPVVEEFAQNADPQHLTDKVLDMVAGLPEPWMLLVFYSTPHFPYAAPAPYYRQYADPGYHGPFKYHKPHDLIEKSRDAKDIEQVRNLYDGAVRAVDDQVDRLLAALGQREGLLDRTVAILTADHGENLYDGDLGMGHGDHLFGEPSLRIPLVFWSRNSLIPSKTTISKVVPGIDLAPTLLGLAGIGDAELPRMDGHSLQPFWLESADQAASTPGKQTTRPADRPVLVETGIWFSEMTDEPHLHNRILYPPLTQLVAIDRGTNHEVTIKQAYTPVVRLAKQRALYQDGRKLVYMPTTEGVRWQLFDPAADPMNFHDLSEKEPETVDRLRQSMMTLLHRNLTIPANLDYLIPVPAETPALQPPPEPAWLKRLGAEERLLP